MLSRPPILCAHPTETGQVKLLLLPTSGSALNFFKFFKASEAYSMWDTCAVELRVNLPRGVAEEVQKVQRTDPDMLSRIVFYAVTRRTIYDTLANRERASLTSQES